MHFCMYVRVYACMRVFAGEVQTSEFAPKAFTLIHALFPAVVPPRPLQSCVSWCFNTFVSDDVLAAVAIHVTEAMPSEPVAVEPEPAVTSDAATVIDGLVPVPDVVDVDVPPTAPADPERERRKQFMALFGTPEV